MRFNFTYFEDCEASAGFPDTKHIDYTVTYDDATTWCVVLEEFIGFLGSVYGYEVRDSIEFKSLKEKIEMLKERGVFDEPRQTKEEFWDEADIWDNKGTEFK